MSEALEKARKQFEEAKVLKKEADKQVEEAEKQLEKEKMYFIEAEKQVEEAGKQSEKEKMHFIEVKKQAYKEKMHFIEAKKQVKEATKQFEENISAGRTIHDILTLGVSTFFTETPYEYEDRRSNEAKEQLKKAEEQVFKAEKQGYKAELQRREAEKQVYKAENRLSEAQTQLKKSQTQLKKSEKKFEEAKKKFEEAEEKFEEAKMQFEEVNEKERQKHKIQALEEQLETTKKEQKEQQEETEKERQKDKEEIQTLKEELDTAKKERQKDKKEIQTLKEQQKANEKERQKDREEQKEKLETLERQMERITRQRVEPSAAALKSAPPTIFSRTLQAAPEEKQLLGTPEHKLEQLTEQWKTLEAQREIASENISRKQKARKMEKLSKQLLQQHRKALKTEYQTLANAKVRGENWNQVENKIQESLAQTDTTQGQTETTELRAEVLEVKRKLEKQIALMKACAGRLGALSNESQLAGKTKAALDQKLKNPRAQDYYYTLVSEMNRLFMAASVAQTGYIAAQNKPGSVSSRASKLLKGIGKLVPNFGGYFEAAGEIAEGIGLHYTERFLSAVAEIAHSPDEMNYIVKTVAYELVMNTPEDDLDAAQAREHMKQMITNFRETELGDKKHDREMIITLFLQALGHSQTATVAFKRKKPGLVKRGWKAFTSCIPSSGAAEASVQGWGRVSQEEASNLVTFSGSAQQSEVETSLSGSGTTSLSTRKKHKM